MGSIETFAVLLVSYAVLVVVHRFSPVKDV
jgi:hypothetical protein